MDLQWPHRMSLMPPCHHFAEDVEDPTNDAEDPRDGPEALEDDGEALNHLEKH